MSTEHARALRNNMTDAERHLWLKLNRRQLDGQKFRRQEPIGKFIVDFVCFERQVVIELDGGQHAAQNEYDNERTRWLESQGFCMLRFWNNAVLENTEGVMERVRETIEKRRER